MKEEGTHNDRLSIRSLCLRNNKKYIYSKGQGKIPRGLSCNYHITNLLKASIAHVQQVHLHAHFQWTETSQNFVFSLIGFQPRRQNCRGEKTISHKKKKQWPVTSYSHLKCRFRLFDPQNCQKFLTPTTRNEAKISLVKNKTQYLLIISKITIKQTIIETELWNVSLPNELH